MDLNQLLSPGETCLLVIDKQAGYFDPALVAIRDRALPDDVPKILEAIDKMVLTARDAGVEVIWTQMVENIEDSPPAISELIGRDPKNMHFTTQVGKSSFDIVGTTQPTNGEKVITKYFYNAFAETDLAEYLRSKGYGSVVIVGGYATRCVLSTVVGANSSGLTVIIPKGLVVNQKHATSEVQTLYDMVDAILGYSLEVSEITDIWTRQDSKKIGYEGRST